MLKRGCSFRLLEDRDMPSVYAAYRRGVFAHLPEFPPDLPADVFKQTMLALLGERIFAPGGEAWIFEARTARGTIPVGLVIAVPNRGHAEPHQFWFPEASPRNRLECSMAWIAEMKQRWKIVIWARVGGAAMFDRLCRYGVLRPVGRFLKSFEDGEDAIIYQSVI